jgi:hypothetical protein
MALVWVMFIASTLLLLMTGRNVIRRAKGQRVVDVRDKPLPWQWDAMFMFFGLIGVVSTVPGLFFDQPHWAIDHVWRLLSMQVKMLPNHALERSKSPLKAIVMQHCSGTCD